MDEVAKTEPVPEPQKGAAQMPASLNPPEFYFEATIVRKKVGTNEVLSQDVVNLGHNYSIIVMQLQQATAEQIASKRVPIGFMVKSNFDGASSKEHFGGLLTPMLGFFQQYYQACLNTLQQANKIVVAKGNTPLPMFGQKHPFRPPQGRRK